MDDTLRYKAYTVLDKAYDAFELHKQKEGGNILIEVEAAEPALR